MPVTDAQMVRMQIMIGAGRTLDDARRKGLVKTKEDEDTFVALQKDILNIFSQGGSLADFGDSSWTDDWEE